MRIFIQLSDLASVDKRYSGENIMIVRYLEVQQYILEHFWHHCSAIEVPVQ